MAAGSGGDESCPSGRGRTATAGADCSTTRHDRRTHRLVADPEFGSDLFERHALLVQPRNFSTPRLIQTATTHRDTCLCSDPMHSRAMYAEPPHQLTDRHAVGVLLSQRSPIRDAQTGLRTGRILRDPATQILDRLTFRTQHRTPRSPQNPANQRRQGIARV